MILVRPVVPNELAELAEWEADNATGATWGIGDLSEEFHHAHSHFLVASQGADLRGYMVARRMPDGFELLNILVPERYRRSGVARRLMDALHQLSGPEPVYLEVRASNVAAQALYAAYGYEQTGVRARYYRDGEDAVLMSRED
jgi:ribosomal-protein-alanine N-acetyltransferase